MQPFQLQACQLILTAISRFAGYSMARLSTWFYLFGLFGFLACDRVSQDVQPTEEELVASDNELITLPDAPLAVNLRAIADPKAPTTFRLSQPPRSGQVSFTPKGLLLYTPDPAFVAGGDEFSVASDAPVGGKPLPPLTFAVTVVPDANQLPCDIGGATDQSETDANAPVSIDVLRNDTFCDRRPNPASLQIETPPQSGVARVVEGKILYTPNRNFTGRDVFIYRVCPTGGSDADCVLSAATVVVNELITNCRLKLQNDQAAFRQRFVTDSLVIPVLANDRLCKANRLLPLDLMVKPTGGTAYLTAKNQIVYKPNRSTTTDRIQYRRCENGDCLDAAVAITVNQPVANCVLKANNNTVQLVLSQPTAAMRRGVILINVLANDAVCAPLQSVRIKANPTNARLQVLPNGMISYAMENPTKPKDLTFVYELLDAQGKTSSATVKISLKP